MKKLEEIGISPTPWSGNFCGRVEDADGEYVANSNNPRVGQFIAAAPELYEALRGLLEIVCDDCKCPYEIEGKCVKCPRVVAAEKALAKAAGEDVANA